MHWIKAAHIIFVIGWMGSLLYVYRLFAYHHKENALIVQQRFQTMEKRLLYGVALPGCLITLATGISLIWEYSYYASAFWFHTKMFFVLLLVFLQFYAGRLRKTLIKDPYVHSQRYFKLLHHVVNVAMVVAIIAVVLKF